MIKLVTVTGNNNSYRFKLLSMISMIITLCYFRYRRSNSACLLRLKISSTFFHPLVMIT